jgi:hypothetical protein
MIIDHTSGQRIVLVEVEDAEIGGLLPWDLAVSEALRLVKEMGRKVHLRDPISDKIVRTVRR